MSSIIKIKDHQHVKRKFNKLRNQEVVWETPYVTSLRGKCEGSGGSLTKETRPPLYFLLRFMTHTLSLRLQKDLMSPY